jgi:mRNA interferase RelE/StbE
LVWKIDFAADALKELNDLDRPVAKRIRGFLRDRLAMLDDPRGIGQALKGDRLGGLWKYRVGDWRIIASIEDDLIRVLVLRIGNRPGAYREPAPASRG